MDMVVRSRPIITSASSIDNLFAYESLLIGETIDPDKDVSTILAQIYNIIDAPNIPKKYSLKL
jgi:hypothetical protein